MMSNKRQSDRRKVFYYLSVENVETGEDIGRLGDISADGLMLLTRTPLPMDKTYHVAVHMPETPRFAAQKLELTVETRWLRPDYNPDILCIGCRYIDTAPEKDEVFNALIEYYGFSDGYKHFKQPAV